MYQTVSSPVMLRPAVSPEEMKLIMSAIGAYSHNINYQKLIDRLEKQIDPKLMAATPKHRS